MIEYFLDIDRLLILLHLFINGWIKFNFISLFYMLSIKESMSCG